VAKGGDCNTRIKSWSKRSAASGLANNPPLPSCIPTSSPLVPPSSREAMVLPHLHSRVVGVAPQTLVVAPLVGRPLVHPSLFQGVARLPLLHPPPPSSPPLVLLVVHPVGLVPLAWVAHLPRASSSSSSRPLGVGPLAVLGVAGFPHLLGALVPHPHSSHRVVLPHLAPSSSPLPQGVGLVALPGQGAPSHLSTPPRPWAPCPWVANSSSKPLHPSLEGVPPLEVHPLAVVLPLQLLPQGLTLTF
jgi:hypothetical protein